MAQNIFTITFQIFCFLSLLELQCYSYHSKKYKHKTTQNPNQRKFCLQIANSLRARHKSCFLRPDTGPCRAEIIQWYFDVRQRKCYRFFWGGCQGNGNRFETLAECQRYCVLNTTEKPTETPHFCNLAFDYGTCFGYYNRWAWDRIAKSCRRRLYSGCGGNQNNFQSSQECIKTCLIPPNNTLLNFGKFTTCISFQVEDMQ